MTTVETDIKQGRDITVRGDDDGRIRDTAREVFGWDPLRPGIALAVSDLLAGRDVLAVMPTGYGKSAVYQLAGALLPGTTVVVSPLIALQADQLASLADRPGARPAAMVNSSQSAARTAEAWSALDDGSLGYLFLSPEQLADDEVVDRLAAASIALVVVDEAHCVSSWGHDFRPDYLRLGDVAERLGRPTLLALTATGSRPVREEVLDRLGMPDAHVLTHGFDRPNIHLAVRRHESEEAQLDAAVADVEGLEKPGLLYVATRRATELLADRLRDRGMRAEPYHGGLPARRRRQLHADFHDGAIDVVVATSAFGMGIDRADLRFVVHADVPESVDAYYQEVGRAGRDGEPAAAKLHYREEDLALRRFFGATAPSRRQLLRFHAASTEDGALRSIAGALGVSARRATSLAGLLVDAGAAELEGDTVRLLEPDGEVAATAALEAAAARERIDASRLAMMRSYAETRGCRRQFLLGYFGDGAAGPCGHCDTCDTGSAARFAAEHERRGDAPFPVDALVRHSAWGDGRVMSTEEDRITVFFAAEGYRTMGLEDVVRRGLLERVSGGGGAA